MIRVVASRSTSADERQVVEVVEPHRRTGVHPHRPAREQPHAAGVRGEDLVGSPRRDRHDRAARLEGHARGPGLAAHRPEVGVAGQRALGVDRDASCRPAPRRPPSGRRRPPGPTHGARGSGRPCARSTRPRGCGTPRPCRGTAASSRGRRGSARTRTGRGTSSGSCTTTKPPSGGRCSAPRPPAVGEDHEQRSQDGDDEAVREGPGVVRGGRHALPSMGRVTALWSAHGSMSSAARGVGRIGACTHPRSTGRPSSRSRAGPWPRAASTSPARREQPSRTPSPATRSRHSRTPSPGCRCSSWAPTRRWRRGSPRRGT